MEFRTYLLKDGYLTQRTVLLSGPIAPGTLVTYVPTVAGIDVRHGLIVAVHDGQVDVFWQGWRECPGIKDGELRQRMGIPNAEQRRKEKRARDVERWKTHKAAKEAKANESPALPDS